VTQPPDGLPELPDDFDFDAEFARAFGPRTPDGETPRPPVGSPTPGGTRPRAIVAVVLTPVSSAPALAGLCAMAGIDATVVPTSRGALAARVIERAGDGDDDLAELIGEAPEIATSMAAALSRTSRYGAILLVSRLGEGDEQVASGLVLAQADDVVEQLLLGVVTPDDAPGAIPPGKLPPWQARRLFRKTQRRPRP